MFKNKDGARRGSQTPDISLTKRVLYQLSYTGITFLVPIGGLEP